MKKTYEKPSMSELDIILEEGFMAGSVFEPNESNQGVHIDGHEVGDQYDYTTTPEDNSWD